MPDQQLTRDDVRQMHADGRRRYQEIEKARTEGRLDDLLHPKADTDDDGTTAA